MKLKTIKCLGAALLCSTLIICNTTSALASSEEYKLRDIDLTVTVPDDIVVFTRETSASNPNFDYIDKEALELTADMEQKHMYMYAVDKDNTFDISIVAVESNEDQYKTLSENELNTIIASTREELELKQRMNFNNAQIYNHKDTPFLMYDLDIPEDSSGPNYVYTLQYITIYGDYKYSITIQSYGKELTASQKELLKDIVDSASFKQLSGSSKSHRMLNEAVDLLIGAGMVIAFLAIVLFIMNISSKKKHPM